MSDEKKKTRSRDVFGYLTDKAKVNPETGVSETGMRFIPVDGAHSKQDVIEALKKAGESGSFRIVADKGVVILAAETVTKVTVQEG